MPDMYQVIANYFPSTSFVAMRDNEIKKSGASAIQNCFGMQIMAQNPTSFQDLFAKFSSAIAGVTSTCTWNGSAGGTGGYPLLDGPKVIGECAMFAKAFQILAYSPAPYGLGLNKNEMSLTSYSGPAKKGFVSAHSADGVVKLRPNVQGQALYFWNNHKVILYRGVYYDVMYGVTYARLQDMALYSVMDDGTDLAEQGPPPRTSTYFTTEPLAGADTPGRQGSWFKESPTGTYFGPSVRMPF